MSENFENLTDEDINNELEELEKVTMEDLAGKEYNVEKKASYDICCLFKELLDEGASKLIINNIFEVEFDSYDIKWVPNGMDKEKWVPKGTNDGDFYLTLYKEKKKVATLSYRDYFLGNTVISKIIKFKKEILIESSDDLSVII